MLQRRYGEVEGGQSRKSPTVRLCCLQGLSLFGAKLLFPDKPLMCHLSALDTPSQCKSQKPVHPRAHVSMGKKEGEVQWGRGLDQPMDSNKLEAPSDSMWLPEGAYTVCSGERTHFRMSCSCCRLNQLWLLLWNTWYMGRCLWPSG